MRTTHLVRALFLILIGSLGTSSARAQSVIAPVIARCPENGEASALKDKKIVTVDVAAIKAGATTPVSIERTVRVNLASSENPAVNTASDNLPSGSVNAVASASQVSLLDEHKLNVKVQFDPRPVGGILTVRVSMTPTFRGIGVSTRPATSRSVAFAVDEFSQETVDKMVNELTEEITAEFKTMNEPTASKSVQDAQVN